MSELDHHDEPTSVQEHADAESQPPQAPKHPTDSVPGPGPAVPIENPSDDPDTVVIVLEGHAAADVEEVISDAAAMELIGAIDRNGSGPAAAIAAEAVPRPSAEAQGIPTVLDAVRSLSDQVSGKLEVIQAMVEREIRAEMTRERVVDRLHAELQEYKQDLLLKVMRPLFVDLIQLYDDIGKMEDARPPAGEAGAEADPVRPLLESIRTGIEDILYRQGVEPFQQEQGTFDARRQRAVTTVPTEDPELNKTVAVRLRKGFQAGEKVIRPEIVSVYTLKK